MKKNNYISFESEYESNVISLSSFCVECYKRYSQEELDKRDYRARVIYQGDGLCEEHFRERLLPKV